jgi:ubiquinone/menaquinone biosynthesis C-methylase UbiE
MLRYGHARAVGLGVAGRAASSQANAESLPFADGAFDFIYSTMFLHETSHAALRNILREVRRLLAPGGLHAHLEQPPYRGMDLFEQFLRDWDCQHNNEPFWSALHETASARHVLRATRFRGDVDIRDRRSMRTSRTKCRKVASEVEDYGRGGMWYACGAEA